MRLIVNHIKATLELIRADFLDPQIGHFAKRID